MVVFNPNNTIHEVKIIPRKSSLSIKFNLRNKTTNVTDEFVLVSTYSNGYLEFSFEFELIDETQFEYDVYDFITNELLFRGLAYSTTQTDLQDYKVTIPTY